MRSTTTRVVAVVMAMLGLLWGAQMAVAPTASAEPGFYVTWPDATQLNMADYSAQISWDGSGVVTFIGWPNGTAGHVETVSTPGEFVPSFLDGGENGDWQFAVSWCPSADSQSGCQWDYSAPTELWRDFEVTRWAFGTGPNAQHWTSLKPDVTSTVDVRWSILDGDQVEAQGSYQATGPGFYAPAVGPQPGLVPGQRYRYVMSVRGDAGPYGVLEGTSSGDFTWDTSVDVDLSYLKVGNFRFADDNQVESDAIFPVADDYRDSLTVAMHHGPPDYNHMSVEVKGPQGDTVFSSHGMNGYGDMDYVEWDGRDESGHVLPEGTYDLQISIVDAAWNVLVVHRAIHLSHEILTPQVWSRTLLPGQAALGEPRSFCGWLKTPARRYWPGSIGYYTKYNCAGSTYVQTTHEIGVPPSPTGRYGRIRLVVNGGQARGEDNARLQYQVADTDAPGFGVRGSFARYVGEHRGTWIDQVAYHQDGKLSVSWSLAAESGDRYDVRSVRIEVEFEVLAEAPPDQLRG